MSRAARHARSAIAGALLAGSLACGCGGGGSAKSPAYPSMPSGEPGAGAGAPASVSPSRAPSDMTPAPAPPPPSGTAAPEATGTEQLAQPPPIDREEARARAKDDLVRAEHELESPSGRDCGTACRALGSMQRATARLCDLAESPDDRRRCDDARSHLADAQRRVLQSCGACAERKSEPR